MTAFEGEKTSLNRPITALADDAATRNYSAPAYTPVIDRNAPAFEAQDAVAVALAAFMMLAPLAVTAMTGGA